MTHPFLAGMSPEHVAAVLEHAHPVTFPAGAAIFAAGAQADRCFLIDQGDVALEVTAPGRSPAVVQTLHGGDVLGWSWLFEPYRWMFDARALTDTTATAVDGAELRSKLAGDHELGYQLMSRFARLMVGRMQAARLQLLDLYDSTA